MAQSPFIHTTTGPHDPADGYKSVTVTVNGKPPRWISVVADTPPPSSTPHRGALNESRDAIAQEITSTEQHVWDDLDPDPESEFAVTTLHLKAGESSTTFTVEAQR